MSLKMLGLFFTKTSDDLFVSVLRGYQIEISDRNVPTGVVISVLLQ